MNIYIELLFVTIIVVYIVDLSGFSESLKEGLSKWLKGPVKRLKPFDCSLCMTWWVGIIYSWIVGELSLPILAYIAGLSLLSMPVGQILMLIKETINHIINQLMNRL